MFAQMNNDIIALTNIFFYIIFSTLNYHLRPHTIGFKEIQILDIQIVPNIINTIFLCPDDSQIITVNHRNTSAITVVLITYTEPWSF